MTSAGTATATVEVAVDPATAFEVFTEEMPAWYQDGPHSWVDRDRAVAVRLEPGVGGRWLEVYDEATGEGYEFGRIRVWEPGRRVVLEWRHHEGGHTTEVDVRFEPVGDGTRVVLEHRGWDRLPPEVATEGVAGVLRGWPVLLGWFDEYLKVDRAPRMVND